MLSRRRFLKALGLGAAGVAIIASVEAVQRLAPPAPNTRPGAFTQHQYDTLAAAAAVFIPSDDVPGASEARVADTLDATALRTPALKTAYVQGIEWLDHAAKQRWGGKQLLDLTAQQRTDLFQALDSHGQARLRPTTSAIDRAVRRVTNTWDDLFGLGGGNGFFVTLRDDVFEAFYTSDVAWQMLHYDGPPQYGGYPGYADNCAIDPRASRKGRGLAAAPAYRAAVDIEIPYAFGGLPAREPAND